MGVSLGEREKNDTPHGLAVGRERGCGGIWFRLSTPGNSNNCKGHMPSPHHPRHPPMAKCHPLRVPSPGWAGEEGAARPPQTFLRPGSDDVIRGEGSGEREQ